MHVISLRFAHAGGRGEATDRCEQRRETSFQAGGVPRNIVRESCVNLSEFEILDF